MKFLSRLFPKRAEKPSADLDKTPIQEVWKEFVETVKPPSVGLLIDRLQAPEFSEALAWLKPPTDCAMAKALMRTLVSCQRIRTWDGDEISLLWVADKDAADRAPPQASMIALGQICSLLRMTASVYWQDIPNDEKSWQKIQVTLDN
jgi:hypothetical protein